MIVHMQQLQAEPWEEIAAVGKVIKAVQKQTVSARPYMMGYVSGVRYLLIYPAAAIPAIRPVFKANPDVLPAM